CATAHSGRSWVTTPSAASSESAIRWTWRPRSDPGRVRHPRSAPRWERECARWSSAVTILRFWRTVWCASSARPLPTDRRRLRFAVAIVLGRNARVEQLDLVTLHPQVERDWERLAEAAGGVGCFVTPDWLRAWWMELGAG